MSAFSLGQLIDNIGALLLRQVTTWTLTTVLIIFLPQYLGAEGLGKTTFATGTMAVLLVVTNLGTTTFMVKRISVRRGEWSDLFWNACLIRTTLAGAVYAVMVVLLHVLSVEHEMRYLLYFTGLTLIVTSIQEAAEATIQGLEKMRWLTAAQIASKLVITIAGIAVLLAGYRVVTFGAVLLGGSLMALAVDGIALAHLGIVRPRFTRLFTHLLIRGGMPFLLAGAISQLYQWVDIALLQALTRNAVVGWYGAALQLCTTLNFLPFILVTALLPRLSWLYNQRDRSGFLALARQGISVVILTSLPIAVGMALVSGRLIDFLGYPDEFRNSVTVLIILAATLPVSGLLMVTSTSVIAMDRQTLWIRLMTASLALDVILNLVFIPVFERVSDNGGVGAAAGSLLAEMFQLTLGLRLLPEGVLSPELYSQTARAIAATTAMGIIVAASELLLDSSLVLTVGIGALTYIGASFLLGAVRVADILNLGRAWSQGRQPAAAADPYEHAAVSTQRA